MSLASEAFARLSLELIETEPKCAGDDRFTADEISTEQILKLAETCAVCSLFTRCRAYAEIERPKVGVWAGKTYRTNRPRVSNATSKGH